MLKKVFKWMGILIAGLLIIIIAFYTTVYFNTESRANKIYEVTLQQLTISTDSASYAMGKHIADIRGCLGCHTSNLEGHAFADEKSPLGILYTSNLTSGKGGINYTSDADWIRVLRHGLNRENKPVIGQANDSFNLSAPLLPTSIKQGEKIAVSIGIKRGGNFDEEVALEFANVPKGVTIDPSSPTIKHGDEEAKITVAAAKDAAIGDFTISVLGHPTKGVDASLGFKISVNRP